jgi:hypothetical protein
LIFFDSPLVLLSRVKSNQAKTREEKEKEKEKEKETEDPSLPLTPSTSLTPH